MPIPAIQLFHLPLFRHSADGKDWPLAALRGLIAGDFDLTQGKRGELLLGSTETLLAKRLGQGKIHLEPSGDLARYRRTP